MSRKYLFLVFVAGIITFVGVGCKSSSENAIPASSSEPPLAFKKFKQPTANPMEQEIKLTSFGGSK
jgi:hypothetical protein